MSSALHIRLLGEFFVGYEDDAASLTVAERVQTLLVYLLLHRHAPQPRLHLAFLLWPDSSESQARTNLRNLLHQLRRVLPNADEYVEADSLNVQWRADAAYRLDVAEFQEALKRARQASATEERRQALEAAVAAYGGDLLPSCYDEWLLPVREELRQNFLTALEELVLHLEQIGDYRAALRHAQRLVQYEPLHEATYVLLMRLHALSGDRAGVLRVYQTCTTMLQRELGVEPGPATREAYERLVRSDAAPQPARPAAPAEAPVAPASAPILVEAPPIRLPAQTTPFVGRQQELAELASLVGAPECRLLTLVGPGGIGKTRLAIQVARQQQAAFADGVYFVPLAPVSSGDLLATAIANTVGLTFSGSADSQTQLLNFLREKQMLLVLDNFEHILEGADLVAALLEQAERVKLLVTSRERLSLHGEWLYEVQGLPVPQAEPKGEQGWPPEENSAVALFVQTARRVRSGFALTVAERPSVTRICQLMEGMPLGIELAAAWARLLPTSEIAEEIERNLDFLTATTRDAPARHRSMRAVFDHSWSLLLPQERLVLSRLSVFQGGFSREAAEQVAGASLPVLSALVDKSLLRRTETGRYDLHELVRQYAGSNLQAQEEAAAREGHSGYYLTMLHERQQALEGAGQIRALAELEAEVGNIRLAWRWATDQMRLPDLIRAARAQMRLHQMRGWLQEGLALFQRAAAVLERDWPLADRDAEYMTALGKMFMYQGNIYLLMQDAKNEARPLLTHSITLLRQAGDEAGVAEASMYLGVVASKAGAYAEADELFHASLGPAQVYKDGYATVLIFAMLGLGAYYTGRYGEALSLMRQSVEQSRANGNYYLTSFTLNFYSTALLSAGRYAEAEAALRESLVLSRTVGDRWMTAGALNYLGQVKGAMGEHAEAEPLFREAVQMFRELGDPWFLSHTLGNQGQMLLTQERWSEAEAAFREALQLAVAQESHRLALDALAGLAAVLVQHGAMERAGELLALVRDEPASSKQAKERAAQLLGEHFAGREPGESRSFEELVAEMMAEAGDGWARGEQWPGLTG
ncbi:MAG TPA: tetratricopeptide repeat protein [Ardenticatenaceae bacterium]|jgi:predicted ATPase/DNA-binding SARP family transcriptional activator